MTSPDPPSTLDQLRLRLQRFHVQNAALRVAARHPSLLSPQAFQELADVTTEHTSVRTIAVAMPENEAWVRLYALSRDRPDFVAAGTLLPRAEANRVRVYREKLPYFCDDTRAGNETERLVARAGLLSYVELPVRDAPRGEVIASFLCAFTDGGGARSAPLSLLEDVADVIGVSLARSIAATRERRLAMILETSGDAMIAWDKDDRIADVNAAAAALADRPREALIGMPRGALLRPLLARGAEGSEDTPSAPHGVRMELLAPDESRVVAATIRTVDDDPIVSAHALLRDMSEVVRAEREASQRVATLRKLEAQHRAVLDNAPLIIFQMDATGRKLLYLNLHAERLLGIPTGEAMSTPSYLRLAHADEESAKAYEAAITSAASGLTRTYEGRLKRRNGDPIDVQGTVYPMWGSDGSVATIEGVLADVSAEREARRRLVQADRLSTLGTLAASVAHEINNPAAFVLLGIDLLDRLLSGSGVQMDDAPRSQATNLVRELRESVRRIVDIAKDLRLFANPAGEVGHRTFVDVNRAIESALMLTRGHLIERAHVVRQLTQVPPVLMEDSRLGQVIVNVLVNAAQAIPKPGASPSSGGGSLPPPGGHTITVGTRVSGNRVLIEVTDTGVGIPEENLDRIWKPFFTTKSRDFGTGLGLSIGRDILDRANGTISVVSPVPGSDPPRGARFTISLPAATSVVSPPSTDRRPVAPPTAVAVHARARVLIIEDEEALAKALAEALGREHDVQVARSGREGLNLLLPAPASPGRAPLNDGGEAPPSPGARRAPLNDGGETPPSPGARRAPDTKREATAISSAERSPTSGDPSASRERPTLVSRYAAELETPRFDVVLCDLRMPELTGDIVYEEVLRRDPAQAARFVFMTGVGFGAEVERFLRESGRPVLEKPFPATEALAQIAKVAGKKRG